MAKVIIEKWQCDRCKDIHDKKPVLSTPKVSAVFHVLDEWSGYTLSWKDLCVTCNKELREAINELQP